MRRSLSRNRPPNTVPPALTSGSSDARRIALPENGVKRNRPSCVTGIGRSSASRDCGGMAERSAAVMSAGSAPKRSKPVMLTLWCAASRLAAVICRRSPPAVSNVICFREITSCSWISVPGSLYLMRILPKRASGRAAPAGDSLRGRGARAGISLRGRIANRSHFSRYTPLDAASVRSLLPVLKHAEGITEIETKGRWRNSRRPFCMIQ